MTSPTPSEPSREELLARTEWAGTLGPYSSLGQRFRLLVSDGEVSGLLRRLYAPLLVTTRQGCGQDAATVTYRIVTPHDGHAGAVLRDDELMGTSTRPARVLAMLQWAMNRRVIEEACVDRLVLHAGGVDLAGAAVLVAGRMEAGKSTLTAGLLDRGLGYLSDEAVAVAADLRVEGYAKPLSLDPGSWPVLPHLAPDVPEGLRPYFAVQWQVAVREIAPVVARSRLRAIVLTRFRSGDSTVLEPAQPRWALGELAHCTFVPEGSTLPVSRLRELAALVEAVPVYRLVAGDLTASVDAVVTTLAQLVGYEGSTGS